MKNINLHYRGRIGKVGRAVNKANEILATEQFYTSIRSYRKFDNSALSPEIIARLMEESGHRIEVKVNWISPVMKTEHNIIVVSGWDFSSNLGTGVNNLIHETVNSIDCLYNILHNKKENPKALNLTAPWVIGAIAEIMVAK